MAWFVVQEKGERAQMVIDRKLLDVVYGAPAEVTVRGFRSYEAAKCAATVADAKLDMAYTKLGIRLRKADVKRTAGALEVAVQAHRAAPTEQTLDAVKAASAAHEAECAELRVLNKTLRALVRK